MDTKAFLYLPSDRVGNFAAFGGAGIETGILNRSKAMIPCGKTPHGQAKKRV
jgi:hypothetical protein